jgi:hypothetical protein
MIRIRSPPDAVAGDTDRVASLARAPSGTTSMAVPTANIASVASQSAILRVVGAGSGGGGGGEVAPRRDGGRAL